MPRCVTWRVGTNALAVATKVTQRPLIPDTASVVAAEIEIAVASAQDERQERRVHVQILKQAQDDR